MRRPEPLRFFCGDPAGDVSGKNEPVPNIVGIGQLLGKKKMGKGSQKCPILL
jgi:hypothetical protein